MVGVVIQRLVHPVEIESQCERFAHPRIGEQRAPHIEGHPAGVLRRLIGFILFDNVIASEITALVLSRPTFWRTFDAEVVGTGLEGLQCDFVIQIVVVADAVEVKAAAVDRQVGGPIIAYPLIGNVLAQSITGDLIGATAQRWGAQWLVQLVIFPEALRQNGQAEQPEQLVFIRLWKFNAHRQA
ncbi:hypothetical protein D3C81_1313520 [compost metagenome]